MIRIKLIIILLGVTLGTSAQITELANGNVGIGTTNPLNKLHVKGDGSSKQILNIHNPSNVNGATIRLSDSQWNSVIKTTPNSGGVSENLDFIVGSKHGMRINERGDVGIGTLAPDAKLTINGNIHAKEIKVDLNVPAPDYVFKEDYKLKSLPEVESFIKANGHLPEIASAKEFEQNGILLGQLDMMLLKKIEELTLYTIQQQKDIKQQNSKIEHQQKEIEKLQLLLRQLSK
ncbi:tail fiber protein [Aquimarina intermedia]|uniref:Endosialidase-like protein n=1 Tax=Aquimarina intermedia TaxID=350814 RepID=A0A5S5CEZ2_9FLAO|nr:tail fiber protein [Aquimarina intermedia]TYP76856.1 hypothetical protein BD809_1011 [Aquimarina intermedia]